MRFSRAAWVTFAVLALGGSHPSGAQQPNLQPSEPTGLQTFGLLALPKGDGNRLACVSDPLGCRIRVESHRGIGSARLIRLGEAWPERIVLQLHLRGLERLALSNGIDTLELSIPSHSGSEPILSLRHGAEEEIGLNPDSPYWTVPEIRGDDDTIPLQDRYIDVLIPQRLYRDSPEEIQIHWVDFYR